MEQPSPPPGGCSERFYDGTTSTRQRNTYEKKVLMNTTSSDEFENIDNAESNKIHDLIRTKIRYVVRKIRLAVSVYYEERIYNLIDFLFCMNSIRTTTENKSKRWGTELSRICLDKIFDDQTIWNFDHVDSLSNPRVMAVNQVSNSKASCIGHIDAC